MHTFRSTIAEVLREQRMLPLLVVGSAVLVLVSLTGLVLDDRVLTGAPIWQKPFKFAVSGVIYGATLAWLLTLLRKGRRWGMRLGAVAGLMLLGELVVITLQVVRGTTSHFNIQTPLDAALWASMGTMIVVLWLSNLAIAVLLLIQRLDDPVLTWAIRLGLGLAIVGMGLAFLMTSPTADQLDGMRNGTDNGIVGAHSVGVPDDDPGLPVTGWSTTGGDLRIPHFIGIHALQAVPLFAFAIGALSRRFPALRTTAMRVRMVWVFGAAFGGLIALTTWQALRGQPLLQPDIATLIALVGLAFATVSGVGAALWSGRAPTESPGPDESASVPDLIDTEEGR